MRDEPLSLRSLHEGGQRVVVLYAGEHAAELTPDLLKGDPRPVTLVVPDGNVRNAVRAARRIPGLEGSQQVRLPGPEVDTFHALASALGIIEGSRVKANS